MAKEKVVTIEDRIPKLKEKRRQKTNRRIILTISIFFIFILSILYFQSPLSKVSSITVKGASNLTTDEVIKLSGISKETSFWKVNPTKLQTKIVAHEQIEEVKITKKFPNKVDIIVKEYVRIGYLFSGNQYHPILENGKLLDHMKEEEYPVDAPILINWTDKEAMDEISRELSKLPKSITNLISEIHHTPKETNPLHLTLYMNDGYEVSITIRDFAKKLSDYPTVKNELDPSIRGIIDLEVSPYFIPYEQAEVIEGDETNESEG